MEAQTWWTASDPGKQIAGAIKGLATHADQHRRRRLMAWRALYLDLPYEWFGQSDVGVWRPKKRSRYNLTQGAVDSTRSRIVASRPRPQVLTVSGEWKLQRKAKLLQRWLDGEYERIKAYDKLSAVVLDALVYGTGVLKVSRDDARDKCRVEKIWVGDLFVDPREERFDSVRSLYQITCADKGVMQAAFPKKAAKIAKVKASTVDDALFPDMQTKSGQMGHDLVTVVEAWRLPAGPDKPGRHVICVGDVCVIDEEWTHDDFPFVLLRWAEDPNRFFGQGMVERGAGIQSDLNEHSSVVQEAYDSFVPKLVLPAGCEISAEEYNDEIGQVIRMSGTAPPFVLTPQAVSPDFLRREDMIAERYYRVCGVSELSAASVKPQGINSGKGMLVYQDTETQRFLTQGRNYERASIDLANLLIRTAREIADDGKAESLTVYGGKDGLEIAEFDKAMFADDEVYHLRTWPVSALSNSVTGKLEEVSQLVQLAGITDPDQIRELLDLPDIEKFQDIESAKRNAIGREIERCLDEEQGQASSYWGPDGLQYAVERSEAEMYDAAIGGAPDETLQLLRNFGGMCRTLLDKLAMAAAPPEPTPDAMPMGAPMGQPMPPGGAPEPPLPEAGPFP